MLSFWVTLSCDDILWSEQFRHEGPVWQVAWAHPKYGKLLASCSYDGRVLIWSETPNGWKSVKEHCVHGSSVNSVAWAPHEHGLRLACVSSDGKASIVSYKEDSREWEEQEWNAHQIGCNAVSWCPSGHTSNLLTALGSAQEELPLFTPMRLATGGCDNLVKIWRFEQGKWILEHELAGHSDWVRDVTWAPNGGVPLLTIVSCSQDRTVLVWRSVDGKTWSKASLNTEPFADTVWRVSFTPTGNLLGVAGGDNKISFWRELVSGGWECVSTEDQHSLASAK